MSALPDGTSRMLESVPVLSVNERAAVEMAITGPLESIKIKDAIVIVAIVNRCDELRLFVESRDHSGSAERLQAEKTET